MKAHFSFKDVPATVYNNHEDVWEIAEELIKANKKDKRKTFTTVCNTKSDADDMQARALSNGINMDCITLCTSTSGEDIVDANLQTNGTLFICSPSIVEGIDKTTKEPEPVICLIDGNMTLSPEEVSQQICRNRNIKRVDIGTMNMTNTQAYTDGHG